MGMLVGSYDQWHADQGWCGYVEPRRCEYLYRWNPVDRLFFLFLVLA